MSEEDNTKWLFLNSQFDDLEKKLNDVAINLEEENNGRLSMEKLQQYILGILGRDEYTMIRENLFQLLKSRAKGKKFSMPKDEESLSLYWANKIAALKRRHKHIQSKKDEVNVLEKDYAEFDSFINSLASGAPVVSAYFIPQLVNFWRNGLRNSIMTVLPKATRKHLEAIIQRNSSHSTSSGIEAHSESAMLSTLAETSLAAAFMESTSQDSGAVRETRTAETISWLQPVPPPTHTLPTQQVQMMPSQAVVHPTLPVRDRDSDHSMSDTKGGVSQSINTLLNSAPRPEMTLTESHTMPPPSAYYHPPPGSVIGPHTYTNGFWEYDQREGFEPYTSPRDARRGSTQYSQYGARRRSSSRQRSNDGFSDWLVGPRDLSTNTLYKE